MLAMRTVRTTWRRMCYDRYGDPGAGPIRWRHSMGRGPVLRYRGPGEAITQLLPELKAHKADLIDLLTHRTIDLDTVLIDGAP